MSVIAAANAAREARTQLKQLPKECAVSLTFCNRGENNPTMQTIGGPASQLVTMDMLRAAKMQWDNEVLPTQRMLYPGGAELYDLSAMVDPELVARGGGEDAGVLVLRGFATRLMGADAMDMLEHELQQQHEDGLVDSKALMRGKVKNKHARHNNCMADFSQDADIAAGKGTVVDLKQYPFLNLLRSHANMWLQQDEPVVCEQNRYGQVEKCGIGWHGDGEREIVLGYRAGEATKEMPLLYQAFYRGEAVGPQTNLTLRRGDCYVMSSVAVGTNWKCSSKLSWRHAAGNPETCSYVETKVQKAQKRAAAEQKKAAKRARAE